MEKKGLKMNLEAEMHLVRAVDEKLMRRVGQSSASTSFMPDIML